MKTFTFIIFILLFVYFSYERILSGSVDSTNPIVYFGKFSFSSASSDDPAQLVFKVSNVAPVFDSIRGKILLNFYTDNPNDPWYFPDIWNNDELTCEEKVARQYPINGNYGVIVNGTDLELSFYDDNTVTWFWTISDCQLNIGEYLQMDAEMHWTNPGGWWEREFSVEDQNILTIYFIMIFFWIPLTIISLILVYLLFTKQNKEIDWNIGLFLYSLSFICISMVFYVLHYLIYAGDGIGIPSFLVVGDVFNNLAELSFMIILLQVVSLCGSPDKLNFVTQLFGGFLLTVYLFCFLIQEIYPGLHPTYIVYKWTCIPGIIMLVTRVIIWTMFITLGCINAYHNHDRRWFLGIFISIFSCWFLVIPFMVLVMSTASFVDQWKTVLGVSQFVYFIVYCLFLLLATPNPISSRINGVSFYVKQIASELSTGNINFMNRLEEDDSL